MNRKIPSRFTQTERDIIVMEYKGGATRSALGRKWGTKTETIGVILRAEGCELRPHFHRKVDGAARDTIVSRYAAGRSLNQISAELNLSLQTISKHLRKAGVHVNPRGAKAREFPPEVIAEVYELWRGGMSQEQLGERLGLSQTHVSRLLAHHGYTAGTRAAKGERHGNWRGGARSASGYRFVRIERDDPMYEMAQLSGYVAEHRLVAARFLGRPLRESETVHHINGDKLDNRLENLQVRQGRHGNGAAFRCRDCGSHNVEPVPLEGPRTDDRT